MAGRSEQEFLRDTCHACRGCQRYNQKSGKAIDRPLHRRIQLNRPSREVGPPLPRINVGVRRRDSTWRKIRSSAIQEIPASINLYCANNWVLAFDVLDYCVPACLQVNSTS